MAIILLIVLSALTAAGTVFVTQFLTAQKSGRKRNICDFIVLFFLTIIASILAEGILKAGRPTFYYHTHSIGKTTLKIFGLGCALSGLSGALAMLFRERKNRKRDILSGIIRIVLISLFGSLILELSWFNLRHYELIGEDKPSRIYRYSEGLVPSKVYFNRAVWKWIRYEENAEKVGFDIWPGSEKFRNVSITIEESKERDPIPLDITYTDESHIKNMAIPQRLIYSGIPRSAIIPLDTIGSSDFLSFGIPDIPTDREYLLTFEVQTNVPVPLEIEPGRMFVSFCLLFFCCAFRPGSGLWQIQWDPRKGTHIALVSFLILTFIAVFIWTAFSSYSGSEEPISVQKEAHTRNHKQYDRLVEALMAHRYALIEKPDHELHRLWDPYDMFQRERLHIPYLWDTAFYNDAYYVYFGVVPAILVLLPYRVLTGSFLELDYAISGFAILALIGAYLLYSQLVSRSFPKMKLGGYLLGFIIIGTSLNLTWVLRRGLVYELAITSGLCFAIWGAALTERAIHSAKFRAFLFFAAGSAASLAVGCRPTMLLVSLVIAARMSQNRRGIGVLHLLCFCIPYAAVMLALMKYNYERFDDPFEFGIRYQLTTENQATGYPRLSVPGILLSTLSYFLNIPSLDFVFPFIHLTVPQIPYHGLLLSDKVLGVLSYPVMWFLPFGVRVRESLRKKGSAVLCGMMLLTGVLISVIAAYFSVTNRYCCDFNWLFAFPAIIVLFCLYESAEGKENSLFVLRGILLLCALSGMLLAAAMAFSGEEDWFQRLAPLQFAKWTYLFSPWK